MATDMDAVAKQAIDAMANASSTIREAIAASLPVAPSQLLTVQIPGTLVTPKDYAFNSALTGFKPLDVRVAEARLVDNMVPVSKLMMGRSGKSVARSYLAALDCLIPVAASVSGTIATPDDSTPLDPRLKTIRDRYNNAMNFLKSPDETDQSRSKISTYVQKQESWNKAVEQYAVAQERQLSIVKQETPVAAEQRQKYLEWVQAHARDYKASIQARYMDWVVHGYKFEVEFNFGVVDISSGMKRVESSKEAYRNLTLIAEDGASEYCGVNLNPPDWAVKIQEVVDNWSTQQKGPSAIEIRGEIKRLKKILISHQGLQKVIQDGTFSTIESNSSKTEEQDTADTALQQAYEKVYTDIKTSDKKTGEGGDFGTLRTAQNNWTSKSLESNKQSNALLGKGSKEEALEFLNRRVKNIELEIADLESQLKSMPGQTSGAPNVRDAEGKTIEEYETKRNADLFATSTGGKPSPFTHISAKVSKSSSSSVKVSSETASSFAAKASFGLFSASGGASHTAAAANAMSSMANLEVEVTMDCMLVEIERPWLHAELFSDHELDTTDAFPLSPGPEKLHEYVQHNRPIPSEYSEFPSYPTAFVVGCNIELEFSGDTSQLESAIESSSTEANLSVGYGPFAISGSHKQSKSSAKTNAQSTATGMRISLQAPQIIGWVQELMPQLPKPKNAAKGIYGLALEVANASTSSAAAVTKAPVAQQSEDTA
ncbi:hypothetical protein BJX64DRAFT_291423 [Aspergillus heterothallicus]